MNSQMSTKQTKARPNKKTAESAEKSLLWNKIQTYTMTFPPFRLLWFWPSFEKVDSAVHVTCEVIFAEELGTMSKNNLRGITLVRGPIWGIHSLTLIISWFGTIQNLSLIIYVWERLSQLVNQCNNSSGNARKQNYTFEEEKHVESNISSSPPWEGVDRINALSVK